MISPTIFKYQIIQPGDSLYAIARKYNTTIRSVIAANPEVDLNFLKIDQILRIPVRLIQNSAIHKFNKLNSQNKLQKLNNYNHKLFINQLDRQVQKLTFGDFDFRHWEFSLNLGASISPDGLVTATVTDVKKRYDESYVSMHFKTTVIEVERFDGKIRVTVQLQFEGIPNKVSIPFSGELKWGPPSKENKFTRNYTFYFEDIEGIEDFQTEESETHIEGPTFEDPTHTGNYYSIEITPLSPTNLGTSLNSICKLQITVMKMVRNENSIVPAAGVRVVITKPTIGTISSSEFTTDANGQGITNYIAPKMMVEEEAEVFIEATELISNNKDSITIVVKKEVSNLIVIAEQDIIPSSPNYMDKIWIKFKGIAKEGNTAYKTVINSTLDNGALIKSISDKTTSGELKLDLFPNEDDYFYYQWNGEKNLDQALNEIITVSIPELEIASQITISVGIDLRLTGVETIYQNFLPGIYNPFLLYVEDVFHKEVDLENLLAYYKITPRVTIEQIEFKSSGLSDFNSNQKDILSFIIAKIASVTMPRESAVYDLVRSNIKNEVDGKWTLVDGFWGITERFRPAVMPSTIGDYKYRFALIWVDDSNLNNNSIDTDYLNVTEFSAEQEWFYTFAVPTLRAYYATFTPYGVFDTMLEASIKIYEGKLEEAMFELGTFFFSSYVTKEINKEQFRIFLEENRKLIVEATGNENLTPDQVAVYMRKAYDNYFPTETAACIGTLFDHIKNKFTENGSFNNSIKSQTIENSLDSYYSLLSWKYFKAYVAGYGTYGVVILSRVNLRSYQAFNDLNMNLTEAPREIFGGGEPNEVIVINEDIICIPFDLTKYITIMLQGSGQQRMEETMYKTLSVLYIITPDSVKMYHYPKIPWQTTMKVGSFELVEFDGDVLERSPIHSIGAAIYIDFEAVRPGEEVSVEITAGENFDRSAWIGIIPASITKGAQEPNDQADITYQNIRGMQEGTLFFRIPKDAPEGLYQFRMFPDDKDGMEAAESKVFRIL